MAEFKTYKGHINPREEKNMSVAAAIISGAAALGGSLINYFNTKKTNQRNEQLMNSQLQRARTDAEKAGFSPLAALGSGNYGMTYETPQMDMSGVSQGLLTLSELSMRKKEFHLQEELKGIQERLSEKQVELLDAQRLNVQADTNLKNAIRPYQVKQAENDAGISDITLKERSHDMAINLANNFIRSTDTGDKALAIRSMSRILNNTGSAYEQDRVQTVMYDFLNSDNHGDMKNVVACYKSTWNPNVYVIQYNNNGVHDTYYYDFHDHSIKQIKKGKY